MDRLGMVAVDQWRDVAQAGELEWWRNKPTEELDAYTERLWTRLGIDREMFAGMRLMDLGCGPTLQGRWFSRTALVAVDPLADQYRAEVPWHRLGLADCVYSVPAEQQIGSEVSKIDALVSINALDHAHDFDACIANVSAYLKRHGLAFLSFDIHDKGDAMHPMALTPKYCEEVYEKHGLEIDRRRVGMRGWLDTWSDARPAYGGGLAYHWWLQKCR